MKKIVSLILSFVLITACFSGCKGKREAVKIAAMDDLNAASLVHILNDSKNGNTKNDYQITTLYKDKEIMDKLNKGEIDVAVAPAYVATTYYSKTKGGSRLLGLTNFGEFTLLENGNTITKITDLKDKEIFVAGDPTDTEYMLRIIMRKSGIKTLNMKITSVADDAALIKAATDGVAKIIAAKEPAKTIILKKATGCRSVMSITKEWNAVADNAKNIQGCVFVTKKFAEKNKRTIKRLLKDLEDGIYKASADKNTTVKLCVENGIFENEEIAQSVLKSSEIKLVLGKEMKTIFKKSIKELHSAGMMSMGDKAPGPVFYYGVED